MPAAAADLGGDCCTDLEDRIAELEATAARKGNRKVSLMISGWVNEEIALWDDGTERNAYIGTSPVQQSRFKFLARPKSIRTGPRAIFSKSASTAIPADNGIRRGRAARGKDP